MSKLWLYCLAVLFFLAASGVQSDTSVELSAEERQWIASHPEVTFTGDPNWLPYEAFDKSGHHVGIVAEFLSVFERKTGLRFTKIPVETWSDAVDMAVQRQVDVLSDDRQNQSVMASHVFTDAYIEHPLVVVSTHSGSSIIDDLNVIRHAKIAYIKGYGYLWALKEAYPEIAFIEVEDIQSGLRQLDAGDIDFFVSSYPLSQYHIQAMSLTGLVIRGQLPVRVKLALGVRSDWPELLSILNKAIDSLSVDDRYQINERWLLNNASHIHDDHWNALLLRTVIILVSVFSIWLFISLVVQRKTRRSEARLIENEKELSKQKEFLQRIIDHSPDSITVKNTDDEYVLVNEAFTSFWGVDADKALNKKITDFFTEEQTEVIQSYDKLALQFKSPVRYEMALADPSSGRQTVFDTIKVALFDDNQLPLGMLSIARDVTERRQLLKELEQFRLFAEASPVGFGMTTPDRKLSYVNATLEKMLLGNADSSTEVIGIDFVEFYSEHGKNLIQNEAIPALLDIGRWDGEVELLAKDGTITRSKQNFHTIRDDAGRLQFICGIAVDVTEEYRIKRELETALESADAANHSKSIFLANMSHEIRTPLNAVIGYAQLLIQNNKLDDECQTQVETIESAGRRLLGLINDVLDLSKIEAGKLELTEERFDLYSELNELVLLMKIRADKAGLRLRYHLELDKDQIIVGDRVKLSQILMNFLGNSIKFTEEGDVDLHASWIDGDVLVVNIRDTGPGINDDELAELFVPFSQGVQGEKFGGTGLGLVLCRRVIHLMGGELTINNRTDQVSGLLVEFRLPFKRVDDTSADLVKHLGAGARLDDSEHITAIVVDDDGASRRLSSMSLNTIGIDVIAEFIDGTEALEFLKESSVDYVFTDVRMPKMTGDSLLKHIRSIDRLSDMRVIAVSASSLEHQKEYYLEVGFDDFISKPIDIYRFNEVIDKFSKPKWKTLQTRIKPAVKADAVKLDGTNLTANDVELMNKALSEIQNGDLDSAKEVLDSGFHSANLAKVRSELLNMITTYQSERAETLLQEMLRENQ